MPPDAVEMFITIRDMHAKCHVLMGKLESLGKTCADPETITNIAFAMHKAHELVDDTRKKLVCSGELLQKIACAIATVSGNVDAIKTAYVTATPDCKMSATLPKKSSDPEGYAALMEYLGVKEEYWKAEDTDECIRVHFPGMCKLISKLAEEGRPLPPGIDPEKTFAIYRLLMRGKKGVDC